MGNQVVLGARPGSGGKAVAYAVALLLLLVLMQWPVGGYAPYDHLPSTSPDHNETMDTDPPAAPVLTSAVFGGASNENIPITWSLSADDGAGDGDVSHYALYVSDAYDYEGDGYSYLGQAGSGEISFTHALAGDGDWFNYFYYVQANDTSGNGNWSGQAGKFVRFLEKGKHLASVPLVQEDTTLEVVLQTLAGSFKHVRYYKSSDQSDHWKTYWTFKTYGTLFDLDHKMGFWIDMTKDDHLVVAGLVPEMTEIELEHNWNLVGYPSFIDRTVSDALAGIDWQKVQGWGATPPNHQKQMGASDIMTAGEGYWIWVDLPQTWEVHNKPLNPPYIIWTDPPDYALDVPLNTSIFVKFSKEMDTSSLSWSLVPQMPGTVWTEHWYENDTLLMLEHSKSLPEGIQFQMLVQKARDKSGDSLVPGPVPNPWTFITVSTGPTIIATDPFDGEVGVPVDMDIIVLFSESMNVSTLSWLVAPDPGGWSETWTNGNTTVILTHINPFPGGTIQVLVDYAEDIYGNALVPGPVPNPFAFWTFSAGPYIVLTDPYDGEMYVDPLLNISIRFSEPMNTSSVSWNFWPNPGGWMVEWRENDTLLVLILSTQFPEGNWFTVQVMDGLDKSGNPLIPGPVPNPWTFHVGTIWPMIVATYPFNLQFGVSSDASIFVNFSEPMNTSSLAWSVTPDPGDWTIDWLASDTLLVMSHSNPFSPGIVTVEISYAEDKSGNPLVPGPAPNPWSFMIISVGTYIVQTDPYDGQLGVPLNQSIFVWFSQPMSQLNWSINPFLAFQPFWLTNTTLELYHPTPFVACQEYEIHIDGLDLNDQPLVPGPVTNPFSFTTDCGNPYIVLTDPYDGEINVELDRDIIVWFSEPMNTSSVNWVVVPDPGGWWTNWSANETVMFMKHSGPLIQCVTYLIIVTEGKDKSGNPLVPGPVPNPWNFTTCGFPYILWTDPTNGSVDIPLDAPIHIYFSQPMNPSSFNWTINPDPGGWLVDWVDSETVILNHSNPFDPFTAYVLTIHYIEDIWGMPLLDLPVEMTFWTI